MTTDPMLLATPDAGRALFAAFSAAANGYPTSAAIDAAVNILVNAIRQDHTTRESAEKAFDELFGRIKQILVNHYDTLGRKRGIFPYDQHLQVDLVVVDDLIHKA